VAIETEQQKRVLTECESVVLIGLTGQFPTLSRWFGKERRGHLRLDHHQGERYLDDPVEEIEDGNDQVTRALEEEPSHSEGHTARPHDFTSRVQPSRIRDTA
jgi:hypothetical protein